MEVFLEFIRTDIDSTFENPQPLSQGMLAEGKVGIERIVESLQCNMWPNMQRKQAPNMAPRPQLYEDEEEKQEQKNEDEPKNINGDEKLEDKKESEEESKDIKQDNTKDSKPADAPTPLYFDPLNPLLPIPDYSQTAHGTSPNDFEKEERNLEELGALMGQLRDMKDQVINLFFFLY